MHISIFFIGVGCAIILCFTAPATEAKPKHLNPQPVTLPVSEVIIYKGENTGVWLAWTLAC